MKISVNISKAELEQKIVAWAEAKLAPGQEPEVNDVIVSTNGDVTVEFLV